MSRYLNNNYIISTNKNFINNEIYSGNLYLNMPYGVFKRRIWKLKYFEYDYNNNNIKLWNSYKLYKNPKIINNLHKYDLNIKYGFINNLSNKNIKFHSLHLKKKKKYFIFSSDNFNIINNIYNYIIGYVKII